MLARRVGNARAVPAGGSDADNGKPPARPTTSLGSSSGRFPRQAADAAAQPVRPRAAVERVRSGRCRAGIVTARQAARGDACRGCRAATYFGRTTVSMTWITPLSVTMSVLMTLALSTVTPLAVATVRSLPCTVFTLPGFTSLAITLPGTTW